MRFGTFAPGHKFGALWVREGRVVGAFLEHGGDDENAWLAEVVAEQPTVTSADDIAQLLGPNLNSDVEVMRGDWV